MKNSKTLFQDFVKQITLKDSREEVSGIAHLVFENLFGVDKTNILAGKLIQVPISQEQRLADIARQLNDQQPVQYVLGEAEFYGRKFKVDPSVLIPRPETEELIAEVIRIVRAGEPKAVTRILDIGTGSGCIPITLTLELKGVDVYATDVSKDALETARGNSHKLKAGVSYIHHDILKEEIPFTDIDLVVSNPPYVALSEKDYMKRNVIDHEPHLALFVPDNDSLIFYKMIAAKAAKVLKPGGWVVVEINEKFGEAVSQVFSENAFHRVEVKKDINGKDRIVKAIKIPLL